MSFFQTKFQKEIFEKVQSTLYVLYSDNHFGILKTPEGEEKGFGFYRGSTDIQIHVYPYRKNSTCITISAVLTYQTPISPGVFEWIARQNPQITFGSLGFIEYKEKPGWGNVVFYSDILGNDFTPISLFNAIENASFIADKWDDHIVQNFGGETTRMSIEKQQNQNKPPEEKWEG
ncbi:MAG: hypothetical protein PHV06_06220 [bacterium]|nr:hypothetical protein [bacterium]